MTEYRYAFIISHYASSPKHNTSLVHCIQSIRNFYGKEPHIYVIDDHSPIKPPSIDDPHIHIHVNPVKQSGEIGTLYWYYLNGDKLPIKDGRAFVIHDSMLCLSTLSIQEIERYPSDIPRMMWYFDRAFGFHHEEITFLLRKISAGDNAQYMKWIEFFNQAGIEWVGCAGMSCLISHKTLAHLHQKYRLFDIVRMIKSREIRMAAERIIGMLFSKEYGHPGQKGPHVICGNIFDHPNLNTPYPYPLAEDDYTTKLEWGQSEKIKNKLGWPFMKTWHGR